MGFTSYHVLLDNSDATTNMVRNIKIITKKASGLNMVFPGVHR
jgi:hypothetical protein